MIRSELADILTLTPYCPINENLKSCGQGRDVRFVIPFTENDTKTPSINRLYGAYLQCSLGRWN